MTRKIFCMLTAVLIMISQVCFAEETYDESDIVNGMGRAYRYEFNDINSDGQVMSGNVAVEDGVLCFSGDGNYLANVFAVENQWAVKVRFRYTGAGIGFMVRSGAQRFKLHIDNGKFGYLDSSNSNNHQWTDSVIHSENTWYEYIITVNNLCAEYYRKSENEDSYTKVWTAPHMTTGGGNEGAQIFTGAGASAELDYLYVYKPGVPDMPDPGVPEPGEYIITDEETVLGFNDRVYYSEEFESENISGGLNISEAQVSDGCLNFMPEGAQKTVYYDSALTDEYFLNFRMKFSSAANLTMYKGTHRFMLNINPRMITANVVGTNTHQVRLDKNIENTWYDWLIKLSAENKATVYYKETDSDKYEMLYSELEFGVNSGQGIRIFSGAEGYVSLDFLRIYSGMYIKSEEIALRDGVMTAKATALYDTPAGKHARNVTGILIVYDKYGYMRYSDIRTYLAEPGKEVGILLSAEGDFDGCTAAFTVWDSMLNYQPLVDVRTMEVNVQ